MSVDSVSANIDLTASYGAKPKSEQQNDVHQQAQKQAIHGNDQQVQRQSETKPSVNTHGQTVGKIVNTKA